MIKLNGSVCLLTPNYDKPATSIFSDFALWLKRKNNISDITIVGKLKKLKALQRQVNP